MPQTALNLIAIGVFVITISSLVGPLINLSPTIPASITAIILCLTAIDTLGWQNQGSTIFLDLFSSKQQRQRVIHHEAGHFLVAYLLDIPIKGYTLSAWEAFKQGYPGKGGVIFDVEAINPNNPAFLEKFSLVWMAGIAAEKMIYGEAWGGQEDKEKIGSALDQAGVSPQLYQQKANLALRRADQMLQQHYSSYQALVKALEEGLSVEECYQKIS
jgi:hypothetical protein